ncbi:aldehyde dehydrogenase family protein, partial [Candidatus Poribacteria bacterium]|nr:aldehyde dehydrogenase family protein [Candidatus Poribacteria bacterium]
GQRCLAVSVAVVVDENNAMVDALAEVASTRRVGNGLDPDTEMGPVITDESRRRIEASVERAVADGAKPLVDGRGCRVPDHEGGFFTAPTILSDVATDGDLARTEVFGPVLALMRAGDLDDAIRIVNGRRYGNQASIYTSDGAAARRFRVEASAGNIGVNVGVAAPMAFFPFSGWNDSFMGDLHGQGAHAVEFYTQTKVVVERWGAPR